MPTHAGIIRHIPYVDFSIPWPDFEVAVSAGYLQSSFGESEDTYEVLTPVTIGDSAGRSLRLMINDMITIIPRVQQLSYAVAYNGWYLVAVASAPQGVLSPPLPDDGQRQRDHEAQRQRDHFRSVLDEPLPDDGQRDHFRSVLDGLMATNSNITVEQAACIRAILAEPFPASASGNILKLEIHLTSPYEDGNPRFFQTTVVPAGGKPTQSRYDRLREGKELI